MSVPMSGEPNTPAENSAVSTDATDQVADEGTRTEGVHTEEVEANAETTSANETEVDTESEAFKAALATKVEEVVGNRVARGIDAQKAKTDAAEARAVAAEGKHSELEQSVADLTKERDEAQTASAEKDKTILKLKLAIEEKVSVDLIDKLKGDSEDELRAAIKAVAGTSRSGSADRIFNGKDPSNQTDSRSSSIIESGRALFKKNA